MDDQANPNDRILARRGAERWVFLIEALRDFRTTGAVAPSSRRLAALLTDPVREQAGRPLNILEVGAGTGSVTRALIPLVASGSRLDVVEANPRFAAGLRHLVRTHPHPAAAHRVRVHEKLIERHRPDHRYDVIVSGLPFTNFAPEQVRAIMDRYLELLHPGGALTYFTYLATGPARRLLGSRSDVSRHWAVERVLTDFQRRHATGRWTVWGNVPPTAVWQLRTPLPSTAPRPLPARAGASR
ncbi:methyltransferase domain-containing protein (plasmid) [Embleya sp. NBC_00888]|uniref:class I SAM-dependent methyltransferase n=1 Tax=Embleya sp. NBC_00888 TaxID=2975960 RepID=UPI002F90E1E4|nr:methyltransferase domain-containing protein [Embleya sp. NBC_00888]